MSSNSYMAATRSSWLASAKNYVWLWGALAAVGLLLFFWTGLASLVSVWSRPEYSHGYLIPVIAIYLFLIQMENEEAVRRGKVERRRLGVAVVFLGLAVG